MEQRSDIALAAEPPQLLILPIWSLPFPRVPYGKMETLTTFELGTAAGTQAPVAFRIWFSYTSSSTWLLLMSMSRRSLGSSDTPSSQS